MRQLTGVHLPLSPQEIDGLMKIPTDWGVETREEEIDNILYAGDSKF